MADPGKGPGGPGPPFFFGNKLRPKGPKNPYLRVGMPAPPPLSEELDPPLGLGGRV